MYACPKCKTLLVKLACKDCGITYPMLQEIPCFIEGQSGDSGAELRRTYDHIYSHHEDVWVDQGRSEDFQSYFSEYARSLSTNRVLELGCGEGTLLAKLTATQKHGIDPSIYALVRASVRSDAKFAVARAEDLPFPRNSFDLVVAVGVMEHFEKPDEATIEVCRVLTPNGHYICLFHTDLNIRERVALKAKEFLYPRLRPKALFMWIRKKIWHPIVQPLRKSYTIENACNCLERSGLTVKQIITRETHTAAQLAGRHVVILVAKKQ